MVTPDWTEQGKEDLGTITQGGHCEQKERTNPGKIEPGASWTPRSLGASGEA